MERKATEKKIRTSLIDQLKLQNKTDYFYTDLAEDYVRYWKIKKKLFEDIEERGPRYVAINGNGIEVERPNESIQLLQKTTATMLNILKDLNLKEPLVDGSDKDDYL